jgi:hypothetical protein
VLLPEVADRVNFTVTHHRFKSGGHSSSGAAGEVTIDRHVVARFSESEHDLSSAHLGRGLGGYLLITPDEALRGTDIVAASVALLDRRLSDAEFSKVDVRQFDHPLWEAFYSLRGSIVSKTEA